MTDVPVQTTLENGSELEATADQLFADMNRMAMQTQNYEIDMERLKAETNLLKAEAGRLEAENRATLARIKAAL